MMNRFLMNKMVVGLAVIASIALLAGAHAEAEQVVVPESDGVLLTSGSQADNGFPAQKYQTFFVGSSDSGVTYKALHRFDVAALREKSATIERITLTIYDKTDELHKDDLLLGVFAVSDANADWREASATWNSLDGDASPKRPWAGFSGLGQPGVDYQTPALAEAFDLADTPEGELEKIEFDLTPIKDTLFPRWLKGDNAGLLIMRLDPITKAETSVGGRAAIITSRFSNDKAHRPVLTVTYGDATKTK